MIYLSLRILVILILFSFFLGCSYNYKKIPTDNTKNLVSVIIYAKSLTINKDSLKKENSINDNIKQINDRLLEEFELWFYKKFSIQGSENEAIVNIQIAKVNLIGTKNNSIFKTLFLQKEDILEINFDFNLVINKEDSSNKKLQISSSIIFSLFDNTTIFKREEMVSNTIKKLII